MIKQLCDKLSSIGVQKNLYPECDREIYSYGYEVMIEFAMCLSAFLAIAMIFDKFIEIVVYSISFMVLRSFGGGVHANRPWKCFLFSTGILLICCLMTEWSFLSNHLSFIFAVNAIAWVVVQQWIPHIEYRKYIKGRCIVNITYGLGLLGSLWLMKCGNIALAQFILLSQTFWWLSAFLGYRQQNN